MDIRSNNDSRFQSALLNPEQPPPEGITAWSGERDTKRFDVYRNNVIVSLVDALANSFDVVQQLVGEPFFRAMAREFLRDPANLPSSPVLANYGASFPGFIATFEPAASLPFLSDVARLEWLRLQALHAADAPPVDRNDLAYRLQHSSASSLKLSFHPSLSLFTSRYAAVSVWAAHQGLMQLAKVKTDQPEQALILRPGLEVELIPLSAADARTVSPLLNGEAPTTDPAQREVLQLLLHRGAIIGAKPRV